MQYTINWDNSENVFVLPDTVMKYVPIASGKALKVLLYLAACKKITTEQIPQIAPKLDNTMSIEDFEDSLYFWEQLNIITHFNMYTTENTENTTTPTETIHNIHTITPKNHTNESLMRATKLLSASEIANKITSSPQLKHLTSSAETILGKHLNNTEKQTLIWLHEYHALNVDVLLILIEFCKSINKTHINYIERIATTWATNDIRTPIQAQNAVQQMQIYYTLEGKIKTQLELHRAFTEKEHNIIASWANSDISIDIITMAYEKTIQTINKVSLPYMQKIIAVWSENNLTTRNAITTYEQDCAVKKRNTINCSENSYDLNKLLEHAKKQILK